jgi:tellurite resistance-related uncharacterized protein
MGPSSPYWIKTCIHAMVASRFTCNQNVWSCVNSGKGNTDFLWLSKCTACSFSKICGNCQWHVLHSSAETWGFSSQKTTRPTKKKITDCLKNARSHRPSETQERILELRGTFLITRLTARNLPHAIAVSSVHRKISWWQFFRRCGPCIWGTHVTTTLAYAVLGSCISKVGKVMGQI